MPLPAAVGGQINVLVTQAALADARRQLAAVTLRLVLGVCRQNGVLTDGTLDVVALLRALT